MHRCLRIPADPKFGHVLGSKMYSDAGRSQPIDEAESEIIASRDGSKRRRGCETGLNASIDLR
jgi:hypothetical protein